MSERIIIDDADHPAVEGGVYVISYCEIVDGYRHAYRVQNRTGSRSWVRYSRTFGHPPDPRCPECDIEAARAAERAEEQSCDTIMQRGTEMTDHKWPTDSQEHIWTKWFTNTGGPKATEYRSCIHPNCKEVEYREVAKA